MSCQIRSSNALIDLHNNGGTIAREYSASELLIIFGLGYKLFDTLSSSMTLKYNIAIHALDSWMQRLLSCPIHVSTVTRGIEQS